MHPSSQTEVEARFRAMEGVAGSTFLAALVCAIASHYFLRPSLTFAVGSLFAGALVFLAWLSATKAKSLQTVVFAALAVVASLGSIVLALNSALPVILAAGLSHLGVALFGLMALAKWQQSAGRP